MKKITFLLATFLIFGFLSFNIQGQTNPPPRSPEELAYFQKLIEQAQNSPIGSVRAIVGLGKYVSKTEFLKQLEPFNVTLISNYLTYVTLDLDVAALIYLRDSEDVVSIRPNLSGRIPTEPRDTRSSEELAYFKQLIEKAQNYGVVRATVGLNIKFTPEGNLTPEQRAAQREAISLMQDKLLSQLIPYQATLVSRYDIVPYMTLDVDATALVFMRDSQLVLNVRGVSRGYPIKKKLRLKPFRFGIYR